MALVNLGLCFPDWSEAQRRHTARQSFVCFCQALLDRAWLWHAPAELVRQRVRLVGAIDELRQPEAAVLFAPHFYGLDAGGVGLIQQAVRKASSIYSTQSNPTVDAWIRGSRQRLGDTMLFSRHEGLKPIVQTLREGRYLYLLPDMDFGPENSLFVPFFGVNAATVPSLARFARLGRARVVPTVTRMTPSGYEVLVEPAWQNFPSDDLQADTLRMNQALERYILSMPEQYYWVHKRFKTRPSGEAGVY